ncbi:MULTISPECIES: helix-turn-helix domain-containing protein [Actinomadura]|uniref:Scr1 family TA system antitoxin-like transcriptional regulator n=1 Tax=Actinomadura yumaensis TaxID=111807 RepID=A0ABW2D1Y1_9ACTN|nr:helix-turn-helix transcriptional regulator [Actinomadura sp. J1-007]MWK36437.1 helix-turn-helix domain-containing protein [Actinomadura sp. J1-007]
MPAQSEPYDAPAIVTFAKELEWRRTKAGHSKKELAAKLGFAESYVGQVELCKNLPSEDFAAALDTFFQADGLFGRLRDRIAETRNARQLPPGFLQYLEYEERATYLRIFSTNLVSGLFQTEAYAHTIMKAYAGSAVNERVAERMERKKIFDRENPPRTFLILDEGVIRRTAGSEVMRDQLEYLLEAGRREKTQLQIVPYAAGHYAGLAGSFTILGFEDSPEVAYTESAGEGVLLEQRDRVALQAVKWDLIQGHTLPADKSLSMIKDAMEQP